MAKSALPFNTHIQRKGAGEFCEVVSTYPALRIRIRAGEYEVPDRLIPEELKRFKRKPRPDYFFAQVRVGPHSFEVADLIYEGPHPSTQSVSSRHRSSETISRQRASY